jgi:DNA-binding winged helix-turn-helix (wHTH) protein
MVINETASSVAAGSTAGRGTLETYDLEVFELNCATRELLRRDTGRRTHVEPKAFDVLVYLVKHRARVVSKRELLQEIWCGQAVCRTALSQCISGLRKTLGDTGRDQKYLRTYNCVGYRFVAPVRGSSSD